jgi:hypothetical protein
MPKLNLFNQDLTKKKNEFRVEEKNDSNSKTHLSKIKKKKIKKETIYNLTAGSSYATTNEIKLIN